MAVMLRNGAELNLKWTFTISLLFHLLLILTLFSYNVFNKSSSFHSRHTPFSAVQVSLVDFPKEGVSEVNNKQLAGSNQKLEVGGKKQEARSQKSEVRNQKQEVRSKKSEIKNLKPDTNVKSGTIPSSEIKRPGSQTPDMARQGSDKKSEGPSSGQFNTLSKETTGTQDARLTTPASQTGGPAIDVSDFKYDYYLGLVRNKVDSRWNQPVSYTQAKKAVVEFTILRNGKIENIRVAESSGDSYFDQTAVRAVSVSNPFPQLPKGYKDNFLKVRYKFIFGNKG